MGANEIEVRTLNRRGEWVEAIPEPLWVGLGLRRARCGKCGHTFSGKRNGLRYREHYAYQHVLALGAG